MNNLYHKFSMKRKKIFEKDHSCKRLKCNQNKENRDVDVLDRDNGELHVDKVSSTVKQEEVTFQHGRKLDGGDAANVEVSKDDETAKMECLDPYQHLPVTGLQNLGNSCYMNAVLQVLRRTKGFVDSVLKISKELDRSLKDETTHINFQIEKVGSLQASQEARPVRQSWTFVGQLAMLMQTMQEVESAYLQRECAVISASPLHFKESLSNFSSAFSGSDQQDAHEFLLVLLSSLQTSIEELSSFRSSMQKLYDKKTVLNVVKKLGGRGFRLGVRKMVPLSLSQTENLDSDAHSNSSIKNGGFFSIFKNKTSVDSGKICFEPFSDDAVSIFEGKLVQETRCLQCETVKSFPQKFQAVSISVPRNKQSASNESDSEDDNDERSSNTSAKWLISGLEACEFINCDDKYFCNQCLHLTEGEMRNRYETLPEVLVVHLKRFTLLNFNHYGKVLDHTAVPLNLTNLIDDAVRYDLFGVVMHAGLFLSSGHYFSVVRSMDGWLHCNDDDISLLTEDEVLELLSTPGSSTPYLLFYEKVHMSANK